MCCLWTQGALEDCRWALRVDEECLKAAVLQGKAHVGLKQYDTAIECYNKAKKIDPRKESVVNDYIDRARIRQAAELDEKRAGETFEASSEAGLVSVLDKLKKPCQPMLYYIGGLELVRQKLSDPLARTLFRSNGGFDLASSHCKISGCLNAEPSNLSASDVELTALYVTILRVACVDSDENQFHVLAMKQLPQQLMTFIECFADVPTCHDVVAAAVDLLLYLSQTARNRSQIVLQYDAVRLISAAFVIAQLQSVQGGSVAINTQRLICNLAMNERLRRELRDDFEQSVVASFISLLDSDSLAAAASATLSVKTMVNLCGDEWLRRRLSVNQSTWSACVRALSKLADQQSAELTSSLVSLLANMATSGTASATQHDLVQLSGICTDLVTRLPASDRSELIDRCYLLLSRVLKVNSECVESIVRKQFINAASRDLHHLLHHQGDEQQQQDEDGDGASDVLRHCLAALTACTLHSDLSRQQLTDSKPPVLRLLVELIVSHQSYDDVLIGNAALCLSHCVHLPSAVDQLTTAAGNPDIVMSLLVLARDQAKPTVQHNCAILIAKLVQQHEPFLDRLRQLHGLEILHSVLRHVEH